MMKKEFLMMCAAGAIVCGMTGNLSATSAGGSKKTVGFGGLGKKSNEVWKHESKARNFNDMLEESQKTGKKNPKAKNLAEELTQEESNLLQQLAGIPATSNNTGAAAAKPQKDDSNNPKSTRQQTGIKTPSSRPPKGSGENNNDPVTARTQDSVETPGKNTVEFNFKNPDVPTDDTVKAYKKEYKKLQNKTKGILNPLNPEDQKHAVTAFAEELGIPVPGNNTSPDEWWNGFVRVITLVAQNDLSYASSLVELSKALAGAKAKNEEFAELFSGICGASRNANEQLDQPCNDDRNLTVNVIHRQSAEIKRLKIELANLVRREKKYHARSNELPTVQARAESAERAYAETQKRLKEVGAERDQLSQNQRDMQKLLDQKDEQIAKLKNLLAETSRKPQNLQSSQVNSQSDKQTMSLNVPSRKSETGSFDFDLSTESD